MLVYGAPGYSLRIERVLRPGAAARCVLVAAGVQSADAIPSLRGFDFEIHVDGDTAIRPLPALACSSAVADAVAELFLQAREVKHFQKSAKARALASALREWAPALRRRWRYGSLIELAAVAVEDGGLVKEFARLYDASALFKTGLYKLPRDVEATGWAILDRLQPSSTTAPATWRAAALCSFGIERILAIQLSMAQLRRMHDCGCFPEGTSCEFGLLIPHRRRRLLWVLPRDVAAPQMWSCLLGFDGWPPVAPDPPEPSSRRLVLAGQVHRERAVSTSPRDTLVAWRVAGVSRCGVELRADEAWATVGGDLAVAQLKDRLLGKGGAADERAEAAFRSAFPHLHRRLRSAPLSMTEAALNEVRARAAATEWSLVDVDCGSNLSSFGSALLFCLCAEFVCGVDAVLYVAESSGAACIGVRTRRGVAVLDPTRMHLSPFEMAARKDAWPSDALMRHGPLPLATAAPVLGEVYEIWEGDAWRLVVLTRVVPGTDTVHFESVTTGGRFARRLSRTPLRPATADVRSLASKKKRRRGAE